MRSFRLRRRTVVLAVGAVLLAGGLLWRFRNGPFPPWTARQAASALAELEIPRGKTICFAPQWSVGNPDAAIDVILAFEVTAFSELERAARRADYRLLSRDDPNLPLVASVSENADSALYRLWRVGDSGSWRMAVLDLKHRRLYASKVVTSY